MQPLDREAVEQLLEQADKAYLTVGYEVPVPTLGDVDDDEREHEEIVESYEITNLGES